MNREELERWLEGARKGHESAVRGLCEVLFPLVRAHVQRHIAPGARRWIEPDDLVQGILLETVQQLPSLPPEGGTEELLRRVYRTAHCRTRDALRNLARLRGESAVPAFPRGGLPREGSVGVVTAEDRRLWLEELVARLPPGYAEVVRLCAFHELTCAEAGRRLGLKADTVRKRYEKARRVLERRLAFEDDL